MGWIKINPVDRPIEVLFEEACRLDALARSIARPGENWTSSILRAVRLLNAPRPCVPCPLCNLEERAFWWDRYRIKSGWVDGDDYCCENCQHDMDQDGIEGLRELLPRDEPPK